MSLPKAFAAAGALAGIVAMGLAGAFQASASPAPGATGAPHAPSEAAAEPIESPSPGGETYGKVCAYCHETGVGPAIRGRDLHPAYITAMVRSGVRAMPAFRQSEISDDRLAAVADYVANH